MEVLIRPLQHVRGKLTVPGDKSISHRALILGALAEGETRIEGLLESADVGSTRRCLEALGVEISSDRGKVIVRGNGLQGFRAPTKPLDCGNSGTTMRLLMGLLAGQGFSTEMTGDSSLSNRPMSRVADPLREMGARFELRDGRFAPLRVTGGALRGIDYDLPVASAQVKSAILLAGLLAEGRTRLSGKIHSRDHTEKMLRFFGADLETSASEIGISGKQRLKGCQVKVPGDPSSAAFWMAAAAICPGSEIEIEGVLLNPSRLGFVSALRKMGAQIEHKIFSEDSEPVGTVWIKGGTLRGIEIGEKEIPRLIDEIPLIAVLGAYADGETVVHGAEELRIKETDRIEAVATNLRKMGATIETFRDGFRIQGPQKLSGTSLPSFDDHRIAMAFSIAALRASGETRILDADCVRISYPAFFERLEAFRRG